MSNGKKIIGLIALSLLAGGGIAGGLYVANTPTNIAPRAAAPVLSPTQVPGLNSSLPTIPPTLAPSPTSTPAASVGVTEDAIIGAFGTADSKLDQNGDGVVNALDLQIFRTKKK